jgi:hypothetical protein
MRILNAENEKEKATLNIQRSTSNEKKKISQSYSLWGEG